MSQSRKKFSTVEARIAKCLTLAALMSGLAYGQSTSQPPTRKVVGYFGATSGATSVNDLIASGAVTHLTHLIWAYAQSADENTNPPVGKPCVAAPSSMTLASLQALKSQNPNLKILISIGGPNSNQTFEDALNWSNPAGNCVENMMFNSATTYPGYIDGIDVDWETPTSGWTEGYNQFLFNLRWYMENEHPGPHWLLTVSINPESNANGWEYMNLAAPNSYPADANAPPVATSVDFFNVRFYNYAYGPDGVTESNAPIHEVDADLYGNGDPSHQGIITVGQVPPDQIVIGIPFFGVHYTSVNNGSNLGQGGVMDTSSSGRPAYSQIASMIAANPSAYQTFHDNDGNAWTWDSSTGDFWTYDDPTTISQKVQYAQAHLLGGTMSWNLQQDTTAGDLTNAIFTSTHFNHIIVGANNVPWGIDPLGDLYQYNANQTPYPWDPEAGSMTQISIGPTGDIWGLNGAGNIYHWVIPGSTLPYWQQVNGSLIQIAVGTNYLWGVNAQGNIFYVRGKPASNSTASQVTWYPLSGNLAQLVLDPSADFDVWGINSAGEVYEYRNGNGGWIDTGGVASQLAVASSTEVAALDRNGNVYTWNGSSWQDRDGQLAQVSITSAGELMGINSTGQIWDLPAGGASWEQIPGSLREFQPSQSLWGLNAQGQIFRYSSGFWTEIPGTL